jgi:predicted DNA-binding transcriptional regulator YafY
MLLLLQGRGRIASAALAQELEVSSRTILRDVDALTEAGLPIIVHRGANGGIELGFDYRTRLTGLSAPEAEALGVILSRPAPELGPLGMQEAAALAREKIMQSLPPGVREQAALGARRFRFDSRTPATSDPRLEAIARAIREGCVLWVTTDTETTREIWPEALVLGADGWRVIDSRSGCGPLAVNDVRAIRIGPPGGVVTP